jgi:hypothetical protein
MQSFRITYNDGHVEIVTAERYRADGLWIIFEDGDRQEVIVSTNMMCEASTVITSAMHLDRCLPSLVDPSLLS